MAKKYNKYFCQNCGNNRLYEEKLLDDEVVVSKKGEWNYVGLADGVESTGNKRCAECGEDWTGEEATAFN